MRDVSGTRLWHSPVSAAVGWWDGVEAAAASTSTWLCLSRTLIYDDEEKMPLDAKSCWKHITEP